MHKLTCILYNYVLGKKHILHGRYADLTFLFKIMDFLLKKTLIDTAHAQLYQYQVKLIGKLKLSVDQQGARSIWHIT